MRWGSFAKWFKLVGWYISFFNLWATSAALFFVYLLLYDRFRINIDSLSPLLSTSEAYWAFLIRTAFSLMEPMVATMHLALIVAVLFSLEEGEGYSYVRYAGGFGPLTVYAAKWAATLLVFTTPILCAKLVAVLSWDTRAALVEGRYLVLLLAVSLAAYASYLFPALSALALLVKRPLYFLLAVFLELYVVESRWTPLMVNYFYMNSVFFFQYHKIPLGFFDIEPSVLLPRLSATLICVLLTLAYYRFWGEVKWR